MSSRFVLPLAILLGLLFFVLDLTTLNVQFWMPSLLLLIVVYRWGRRRDIYITAAFLSLLILINYQLDEGWTFSNAFFDHLMPFAVLWIMAWLLAEHRQLQDQLALQHRRLLQHEQELAAQVKARTAALEASEQKLATIFRTNPGGIAISRLADGRFLEANPAYLAMVGYTHEELIGHTSMELGIITPDDRTRLIATLQADGRASGLDLTIRTKRGTPLDTYFSIEVLHLEHESWMVSSVVDFSEQKRLQRELHRLNTELEERVVRRTADLNSALADLQRANQLKDEFMAMISHELRTPLTGVLSMAELLEEQVAGPLNARQSFYIKGVITSGERLLHLVNGILGYTHLLSGRVALDIAPVDLGSLLDICATSQAHKAAAKAQTIAVVVEPPDLTLTGDATAVAEVLKRLLDNAVKFTPAGGQIGLEAHTGCTENAVDLVVWDTGIGIDEDQFAYILHPFAQADGRLARAHDGLGLGLAYVDQMVRLLGGTLHLASEPGQGSRFTITLPT